VGGRGAGKSRGGSQPGVALRSLLRQPVHVAARPPRQLLVAGRDRRGLLPSTARSPHGRHGVGQRRVLGRNAPGCLPRSVEHRVDVGATNSLPAAEERGRYLATPEQRPDRGDRESQVSRDLLRRHHLGPPVVRHALGPRCVRVLGARDRSRARGLAGAARSARRQRPRRGGGLPKVADLFRIHVPSLGQSANGLMRGGLRPSDTMRQADPRWTS
jgi:hypothetical protein